MQASEQTGGIFDVTCAPLINLWGFGFTKFDSITPQLVDSIRHFVGFRKVRLQGNRVMKDDPRILLNFSVLGGGTICNIIACLFDRKGISSGVSIYKFKILVFCFGGWFIGAYL